MIKRATCKCHHAWLFVTKIFVVCLIFWPKDFDKKRKSKALSVGNDNHVLLDVLVQYKLCSCLSPLFVTWKKVVNGSEPRLRGCIGTLEARWLINGFKDYALNRYHQFICAVHMLSFQTSHIYSMENVYEPPFIFT